MDESEYKYTDWYIEGENYNNDCHKNEYEEELSLDNRERARQINGTI